MTEQPPDFTGTAEPGQQHPASQRLERLLRAIKQLKSEISGVEARYPGFGSELSSFCDTVIADLNSLNSQNSVGQQADRDNLNVNLDKETAMPELVPTAKHNTNPLLWAIDKAGSHLITGLDKTGDGIIFILGKLFTNRISKAESGAPAEADLSNS